MAEILGAGKSSLSSGLGEESSTTGLCTEPAAAVLLMSRSSLSMKTCLAGEEDVASAEGDNVSEGQARLVIVTISGSVADITGGCVVICATANGSEAVGRSGACYSGTDGTNLNTVSCPSWLGTRCNSICAVEESTATSEELTAELNSAGSGGTVLDWAGTRVAALRARSTSNRRDPFAEWPRAPHGSVSGGVRAPTSLPGSRNRRLSTS